MNHNYSKRNVGTGGTFVLFFHYIIFFQTRKTKSRKTCGKENEIYDQSTEKRGCPHGHLTGNESLCSSHTCLKLVT